MPWERNGEAKQISKTPALNFEISLAGKSASKQVIFERAKGSSNWRKLPAQRAALTIDSMTNCNTQQNVHQSHLCA